MMGGNEGGGAQPTGPFPGGAAALFITFCAFFLTGFSVALLGLQPDAGVIGIARAIGFGVTGSLAARRVPPPHIERLGLRSFDPKFLPLIVMLVPILVLSSELDNVMRTTPVPDLEPWTHAPLLDVLQIGIVIVALLPVVEEWFFRGVLQQGLVDSFGRAMGVLFAAGLYSLPRIQISDDTGVTVASVAGTIATGCLLGTLRLATGSILAPILLSAGISASYLWADAYSDIFPIEGLTAPGTTPFNILLPSLLAVAWGVSQLFAALKEADALEAETGQEDDDEEAA